MEPKGEVILASNGVAVRTYRESGFQPIPKVFLEDAEYGRGLQRFVPACTDIVIVNSAERKIYLALRRSKPMTGWWWFGGSIMPNETPIESAARCFKRETGVELRPEALTLRLVGDYLWKDRQQEPQNIGCHMLGYTFSVELAPELHIREMKLEPNEFEAEKGLTPFGRSELVEAEVFPAIIDLYDAVFPPEVLHHVVLISFKENTPESVVRDIYDRYQTLADDCGGKKAGILSWRVKRNLDLRKQVHLVEVATFAGNDALQAFRIHPKHKAITDTLSKVADWQVGDIMD